MVVEGALCDLEPEIIESHFVSCGETPPCEKVHCYRHVQCLVSATVAQVVAGCRSWPESRDLFCVCPWTDDQPLSTLKLVLSFAMSSTDTDTSPSTTSSKITVIASTVSSTTSTSVGGGLSGGAIAGIVIGVITLLVILAIIAFFVIRAVKERRKNHGEYRPHWEEVHHAKNLPYLQPPAVEGLI